MSLDDRKQDALEEIRYTLRSIPAEHRVPLINQLMKARENCGTIGDIILCLTEPFDNDFLSWVERKAPADVVRG